MQLIFAGLLGSRVLINYVIISIYVLYLLLVFHAFNPKTQHSLGRQQLIRKIDSFSSLKQTKISVQLVVTKED